MMFKRYNRRRRLLDRAARYLEPEELAHGQVHRGRLFLFDASFRLTRSGDLEAVDIPDDEWLRDRAQSESEPERTWQVIAFLKTRRMAEPDEVVRRARTGELYDENYFTKRGGGAPYVDYPLESGGHEGIVAVAPQMAQELKDVGATNVLDMGAATGHLVREIERVGIEAAGVDISDWAIENRVTDSVVKGTALDLPFPDDHFDTITSQDFMEHMHPDDLPQVLTEQVRVTKTGAHIFHLIPYYDSDEPFQLDAHLCQASQKWWLELFERTPGIELVRPDVGGDAERILERHIELRRV